MTHFSRMNNIKILDCTLRDGGYINDWHFGKDVICALIQNLEKSQVDYIECGFFKDIEYDKNKTIFSNINKLPDFLSKKNAKYTLMINFGKYPIEKIPQNSKPNFLFRVAFKKDDYKNALNYCKELINKGYDIFVNPMHINTYTDVELLDLITLVNKINPKYFTIVDTIGAMKESDISRVFYLIDKNLNKNISLCLHSHNNMQLSFSNAQSLMRICKKRDLIIDASLFGMGRGAGNLRTELIAQYLNENYGGQYNILPLLKSVNEQINPIFQKTPWGYSVHYYLAAINNCHPNYAKFLIDKKTVDIEIINQLLQEIQQDKKLTYDENIICKIYKEKCSVK